MIQFLFMSTSNTPAWPSRETHGAFHNRGSLFTRTDPKLLELSSRLKDNTSSRAQTNESKQYVPHPPNQDNSSRVAQQPRLHSAKGRLEAPFKPVHLLRQPLAVVEALPGTGTNRRSASARAGTGDFANPLKLLNTFRQEHLKKIQRLKKELREERQHQAMAIREKKWHVPGSAKARTFDDYLPQKKKPKEKPAESMEMRNLSGSLMISHIDREPAHKPRASEEENALPVVVKENSNGEEPLPETLEPLKPWLTKAVPQAVTGISTENCLVFLPSLLLVEDWADLPELPPEISSDDFLPCSEVILPVPPIKKYEHPFNERRIPNFNWTCNHGGASGQSMSDAGNKMMSIPRMPGRDMGVEREEIAELERLMQGEGSLLSGCVVCKYQAEISLLRKMSEQTLARVPKLQPHSDADPDPSEEDTFGLVEACRTHGEAMQQIQQQHQQCITALSHLESDLDIPHHQRGFSLVKTATDAMPHGKCHSPQGLSSTPTISPTPTQPPLDKEGLLLASEDQLQSSAESQSDVRRSSVFTAAVKSMDAKQLSLHCEYSVNSPDPSRCDIQTTGHGDIRETCKGADETQTLSDSQSQESNAEVVNPSVGGKSPPSSKYKPDRNLSCLGSQANTKTALQTNKKMDGLGVPSSQTRTSVEKHTLACSMSPFVGTDSKSEPAKQRQSIQEMGAQGGRQAGKTGEKKSCKEADVNEQTRPVRDNNQGAGGKRHMKDRQIASGQSSWCYCNGYPSALLHKEGCPFVPKSHATD